jgi:hypothetical protein
VEFVVEQLLDVGKGKVGESASQRSRRRNANAEELVAFAVLSGPGLEEALEEDGVLGTTGVAEGVADGGEARWH